MTMESPIDDALDVAERLFAAISAGDLDAIYDLYSPEAVIWHSFDDIEQDRDENVRVLGWAIKNLGNMRYTAVRRTRTDAGFAQQHVLRATNVAGAEIEVPASLFVTVENGRIVRLDEYIDSEHIRQMTAK